MKAPTSAWLANALQSVTTFSQRYSLGVILVYLALTAAGTWLAATKLEVDTDTNSMISEDLPWRQAERAYDRAFPGTQHSIVVLIEGRTPEVADATRDALREALGKPSDVIASVEDPVGPFFERNALLYLNTPELQNLVTDLQKAQPFLGRLSSDPSLSGLMSLFTDIFRHSQFQLPIKLSDITDPVAERLNAAARGESEILSWQSLVAGQKLPDNGRRFLIVRAQNTDSEQKALDVVRAAVQLVRAMPDVSARIRLSGDIPLWVDELEAAFDGAYLSAFVSLALIALILYVGLQSVELVVACLLALLAGLAITAGFAVLAVGRLNLISVAFSTLYIGIAVDYGVNLAMRYREQRAEGREHGAILAESGGDVGVALTLCALTTAFGFFSFLPTSYHGVAELGLIAGVGLIIGLITTLTLLPALIDRMPPAHRAKVREAGMPVMLAGLLNWPARNPKPTRIIAIVLALGSIALLPQVGFDYNPMHLKPAKTESLQVYEDLTTSGDSPLTLSVLTDSAEAAEDLANRLEALPGIGRVLTLGRLIPSGQDEKLDLIDELNLSLGLGLPANLKLREPNVRRDLKALRALRDAARKAKTGDAETRTRLADAIDLWLNSLTGLPPDQQLDRLEDLQHDLLGGLPRLLALLHRALDASAVTAEDLPTSLQSQWVSANGRHRVEVSAAGNLNDNRVLINFVKTVQSVAPNATGAPVSFIASGRTVVESFQQAFAAAFVIILVLLLVLLRSVKDTLRAMAPLVLGSLLIGAACVLADLPLNFANVIALPLMLGVGVDNGVLILWRGRQDGVRGVNPVLSGTGRAVAIAGLTTLVSFASLMLSAHRGMASMGLLLTLALFIFLACTFLILPALLQTFPKIRNPKHSSTPTVP
ncbi:MAG: MMPL family transporter [Pseudomonadota bacterium]